MATVEQHLNRGIRTDGEIARAKANGGPSAATKNVGQTERVLSALGGGALALYGLKHGGIGGVAMAAAGGGLIYRAATGHCELYKALGVNSAAHSSHASLGPGEGIRVEKSVTIDKPRAEVYAFWRVLENLPRFMDHLESVASTGPLISHWIVKGPAGTRFEWDAEIITDEKNELIGWRSLEGSEVDSAGSVRFADAPNGRGTEVHVTLRYSPPAGKLGAAVAYLFGEDANTQVGEDLRRLKRVLETGGTVTTEGQPSGRTS
jgi:uncharacterized membrane protein